jgi:hypothetical protein
MSGFSALTGGGAPSVSASSSAKSGDTGASTVGINIGGINTGTQSSTPSWFYAAALGLAAVAALMFLRHR